VFEKSGVGLHLVSSYNLVNTIVFISAIYTFITFLFKLLLFQSRDRGDRGGDRFGERVDRFDRERGDRAERDSYQSRGPRQSAPKVDDEHDFPSLG
jgi:hypothetical protein